MIRTAGERWFLWAGFCLFHYAAVADRMLDFRQDWFIGLDTGGANWELLYRHADITRLRRADMVTGHTERTCQRIKILFSMVQSLATRSRLDGTARSRSRQARSGRRTAQAASDRDVTRTIRAETGFDALADRVRTFQHVRCSGGLSEVRGRLPDIAKSTLTTQTIKSGHNVNHSALDAGFLDDRMPLLDLGLGGCHSKRGRALLLRRRNLLAEVAQALAQRRGSAIAARGCRAKFVDRLLRRALRHPEPVPGRDVDRRGRRHRPRSE